jgi:hypothetical protein
LTGTMTDQDAGFITPIVPVTRRQTCAGTGGAAY